MRTLILLHPAHGEVSRYIISGILTKERIIQQWKWRYGKKFYECTINQELL